MRFANVNDWFNYVKDTSLEDLRQLMGEWLNLEKYLDDVSKVKVSPIEIATARSKLNGTDLEEQFWDQSLQYLEYNPGLDELLNYLIDNRIALLTLGHLSLPDQFLWRLVDDVDEAILTLGKRYYQNQKYSIEDFIWFLNKYHNKPWLWDSLLHGELLGYGCSPDAGKSTILVKLLFAKTDFDDLKRYVIQTRIAKRLEKTSCQKLLLKYYRTNNPYYWRAIASNPAAPSFLLQELSIVEKVKYASQIRNLAKINLECK